jgi:putative FmdB family regulatory protein
MPTYDYRCRDCGTEFESFQRIGARAPACRACGGRTEKLLLTAPAIHGAMAAGREAAMRSLPECGKGCRCCP